MQKIEHGTHSIELFSTIKELPIQRHKAMQAMLLQDSGIGSDMSSIDQRLSSAITFLNANKPAEAATEIANFRYAIFSMAEKIDYKTKSFACLVKSINGKEFIDLTNEGLEAVCVEIEATNISREELDNHFENVKKNLTPN